MPAAQKLHGGVPMKALYLLAYASFALISHAAGAQTAKHAEMEVIYASGFYSNARTSILALDYREGDSMPSSLTFTVEGRKFRASISSIRPTDCGDYYSAHLYIPDERFVSDLELIDYTQVRCRLYVSHKWHATVTSREPDGSTSKMKMMGNPED
jgi:hypothetical protein